MSVSAESDARFDALVCGVGHVLRQRKLRKFARAVAAGRAVHPVIEPYRAADVVSAAVVVHPFLQGEIGGIGTGFLRNRLRGRHDRYRGILPGIIRHRPDIQVEIREKAIEQLAQRTSHGEKPQRDFSGRHSVVSIAGEFRHPYHV